MKKPIYENEEIKIYEERQPVKTVFDLGMPSYQYEMYRGDSLVAVFYAKVYFESYLTELVANDLLRKQIKQLKKDVVDAEKNVSENLKDKIKELDREKEQLEKIRDYISEQLEY